MTRLIFRNDEGWDYAIYQWRDDGLEANQLEGNWAEVEVELGDGELTHTLPSRLELRPTGDTAWELRVAASRAKNGGEAADAWEPLSGSFAIRNGSIADPDLIEPQAVLMRFPAGLAPTSGLQVARPTPVDDDAAVGSEIGVEEAIHSGDGDGEPAAFAAGPQIPFQSSSPRSDATALSLGRSLETNEQPAQSTGAAPARRSTSADGANGRPRSDEAQ